LRKKIIYNVNIPLLFTVLALLSFGLVMLYSVSTVESLDKFGNTTYYFTHQLLYGVIPGLVAMFALSKIDYHVWQKYLPFILAVSLMLLAMVKMPNVGVEINGASRWVEFGPVSFQPSELAKLALVIYLAVWVHKKKHHLNDFFYGLLPSLCIVGLFSLLILWQPDLGTMLVFVGVSFIMLFVAGMKWKHMLVSLVSGVSVLALLIRLEPYRLRRITTFFDPSIDPQGISYQINQAMLAIGSGSLWGYGYGLSRQKHNYLPEPLGDSVFAIIAEELGFIRVLAVLVLFLVFALIGLKMAKNAPDVLGKMLAVGIVSWISLQAFINVAAMLHLVPLTGIPLPFFSYGSSSLLVILSAIGILLNISRQSHVAK
jgi:cell division protein FtsW